MHLQYFGFRNANCQCRCHDFNMLSTASWSTTLYSITPFTLTAMSFFSNSSGFIINGGEFVNIEGTNKIEKGKHIFVHS